MLQISFRFWVNPYDSNLEALLMKEWFTLWDVILFNYWITWVELLVISRIQACHCFDFITDDNCLSTDKIVLCMFDCLP